MNEVNALPPEEQDAVASLILEEIESEKRWDASLVPKVHLGTRLLMQFHCRSRSRDRESTVSQPLLAG